MRPTVDCRTRFALGARLRFACDILGRVRSGFGRRLKSRPRGKSADRLFSGGREESGRSRWLCFDKRGIARCLVGSRRLFGGCGCKKARLGLQLYQFL